MPPADAPVHPAATLFPPLSDTARAELRTDIASNGVIEPIFVDPKGRLLDGRHRLAVAHELGIACPTLVYDGPDPLGFVVSLNLHRRHLTDRERADIAAEIAKRGHGGDRRSQRTERPDGHLNRTQAEAAAFLNVSTRSVRRAVARKHGKPTKPVRTKGPDALGQGIVAGIDDMIATSMQVPVVPLAPQTNGEVKGAKSPALDIVELLAVIERLTAFTKTIRGQELRDLVAPDDQAVLWRQLEAISSWANLAFLTPPSPRP